MTPEDQDEPQQTAAPLRKVLNPATLKALDAFARDQDKRLRGLQTIGTYLQEQQAKMGVYAEQLDRWKGAQEAMARSFATIKAPAAFELPDLAPEPLPAETLLAIRESRRLQEDADRAAIEHMPAMAAAIVAQAERDRTESVKNTVILLLTVAILVVTIVGMLR